jgi:hypothetical protein
MLLIFIVLEAIEHIQHLDARFESIGLVCGGQNVRFLNTKLSRILNNYDPLLFRNRRKRLCFLLASAPWLT